MDAIEIAGENLTSPPVLAFLLGAIATGVRSDLRLPDAIYQALTIYLLFAIGLKGGGALSEADPGDVWAPAGVTLLLGVVIPVAAYGVLRTLARFSIADAAAMGAHYGSVSVVTFTAAIAFLDGIDEPYEGYLPALVALLEVPAIIVALGIARWRLANGGSSSGAIREVIAGRSILLLVGGLAIGLAAGRDGLEQTAPFFEAPFVGALTLFLLEMGVVAASRARDLRSVGAPLIVFALAAPLVNGAAGVVLGDLAGLSQGGATILGALAASASYIAAPAAVRIALPEANPSYYLTASLAITFPFNLALGIPLYYELAIWLPG